MMKEKSFVKTVTTNMIYAYVSQALSTLIGIVFTMLIPKILGLEGYGYWQLIVFYSTYLGVFYFGVNDGIYLKNGGKELEEINKPVIARIGRLFFYFHILLGLLFVLCSFTFINDENRIFVLVATAFYLPFFNIKGMLGQVMQALNNTQISSISNLIDRVVVFCGVIIGFAFQQKDFKYYVAFYVLGGIVSTIYCCYKARHIICCKTKCTEKLSLEIKDDIKSGLPLMISSFSALMITGISRQIIDMRWEIGEFGKISLALTMMNLVLVFLNQTSLVLFPAIRKIGNTSQTQLYCSLNKLINIVVPLVLVMYVPIGKFINLWLPDYHESIKFLGVLLPMCIWDGKMNLLNNTYYKVLRMERQLLIINIGTLVLNSVCSLVGAYVFSDINVIAYGLLISISIRSLVSEIILQRKLNAKVDFYFVIPIISSALYITLNNMFPGWKAFGIYLVYYAIVFVVWNNVVKMSYNSFIKVFKENK